MSSIKIVQASQANRIYQYKNVKRKILKCCMTTFINIIVNKDTTGCPLSKLVVRNTDLLLSVSNTSGHPQVVKIHKN